MTGSYINAQYITKETESFTSLQEDQKFKKDQNPHTLDMADVNLIMDLEVNK